MGDLFGGPFFVPASLDCGGTMGGVMTALMIPVAPPPLAAGAATFSRSSVGWQKESASEFLVSP